MNSAHLVRVAGDDDGEFVAVVLHQLDQRVHRLLAEVAAGLGRVSEYASSMNSTPPRALGRPRPLERGLPDVAGDEIRARGLDERAALTDSDVAVHLADQPGDGRLARSRVAREDEVSRYWRRRHSPFRAEARHSVEADDLVDLGLHRGRAR